jgi:hypothetical protein
MDAQRLETKRWKREIRARASENPKRVESLVDTYENVLTPRRQGRRTASDSDVLRAAVVLLHATLEDVIRSVQSWKLPMASPQVLNELALAGAQRGARVQLGDLARFRGRTIEDVIRESVEIHLDRSNYNSCQEITGALEAVGVKVDPAVCSTGR